MGREKAAKEKNGKWKFRGKKTGKWYKKRGKKALKCIFKGYKLLHPSAVGAAI